MDYPAQKPDMDENLERIAEFLSLGLGYTLKSNAWAGPDHWKYHKAKGNSRMTALINLLDDNSVM